ncbi:MAG: hypothetical protein H3C26_16115 [Rhodocyclaceae bacterium]|nr:hypothetical protein [Rhodocyclaceae bacterium]
MANPTKKTPFIAECFFAQDDDGNRYEIRYWKYRVVTTFLSGETDVTTMGWKYETAEGRSINTTDDGQFELAEDRRRLTRE